MIFHSYKCTRCGYTWVADDTRLGRDCHGCDGVGEIMVGEEVKEVEPPLHQIVKPHPLVGSHLREFPQPDIISKAHFDAHNGWQKVVAKLKADFPTVSTHGRHPKEKGLIIRATPERAREVSRSMQRRVTYLGSHAGGEESRHAPGHYWQIHPVAIGTRIVGKAAPKPTSDEHPRMADRRRDVFAHKVGAVFDAARRRPPQLKALPGGRADDLIRSRLKT